MTEKSSTNLTGVVEKIIKPIMPNEPEKAQIAVEQADHLYREIRIDNNMIDSDGHAVRLKPGAEVEVVITADRTGRRKTIVAVLQGGRTA
jgi:uncharacterized cupredoxin-like copper-binding protein